MNTVYISAMVGLFFFILGIYIGLNEKEQILTTPERDPKAPLPEIILPTTKDKGKVGVVKRPSAEALEEKNKPDRLKETEKAMEDTLDGIL